jgi:PAS domain S-box-containing protein
MTRIPKEVLDEVVQCAGDGIVVVNAEQQILLFNEQASRLFGYKQEQIVNQKLDILIPSKFYEAHSKHVTGFGQGEVSRQLMGERPEVYGRRKDGTTFPAEVAISKTTVSGVLFYTAIIRDITSRKDTEIRLQRAMAQLTEANKQLIALMTMKEAFFGMAAHDLRSPISRIKMASEILLDETAPANQRQHLNEIVFRTSESMLVLINDLLDITKIEAGKISLKYEEVNLYDYLDYVQTASSILGSRKGITLVLDVEPNLPIVLIDPARMRQVLENLLSNAIKFSNSGTTVTIKVRKSAENIEISVCDQGQGIKDYDMPRLFGAFQQLGTRPTAGEPGTGLGLAIAKKIVEIHMGTIRAESEFGKGSNFIITFPISPMSDRRRVD